MALVKENKIFIRQTSKILAMDLIYHISDISNGTLYNQRTKILYNSVQKSMARYITLLSRICNDLFDDFDISTLRTIADDLFRDKSCSWGRIISLFTFCGVLVRQSVSKEMYTTIDDIAIVIGSYIANHLTDWNYNQGGWVSILGCINYFRVYEIIYVKITVSFLNINTMFVIFTERLHNISTQPLSGLTYTSNLSKCVTVRIVNCNHKSFADIGQSSSFMSICHKHAPNNGISLSPQIGLSCIECRLLLIAADTQKTMTEKKILYALCI